MLYFDHCATTPPHPKVIEAIAQVMNIYYGNPSSIHQIGLEAERLVIKAREVVADALGVSTSEIVFTSGGTESNNMAIKGIALQPKNSGKHIIASAMEHASVYECFKQLEKTGFSVTWLPVDKTGAVRAEDVRAALNDNTVLVSVMHVNNETGRIQPIADIGHLLRSFKRTVFHVDAVQGFGKLPLRPAELGIDLLSISAHKLNGPKGSGLLYVRDGVRLEPLLYGGGQESGRRSGTENVPGIVGMAKAVRMAAQNRVQVQQYLSRLRMLLIERLKSIPEIVLTGSFEANDMAPHIVHFLLPGMKSEVFVHALEQRHIYVSTQSACSSGESRPSRVLEAMGLDRNHASSGVRICLASEHTEQHIMVLADAIESVIRQIKPIMRSY